MISNKRTGPKQVLTKEFIYKIVLLEVVGFSLILPAVSSTGELILPTTFTANGNTCIVTGTINQVCSGTSTCMQLVKQTSCVQSTITFATPFATIPTQPPSYQFISTQGLFGTEPVYYTFSAPATPVTWTNMPAAQTELYGCAQPCSTNEVFIPDLTAFKGEPCFFEAFIQSLGFAGATLSLQWSGDRTIWNDWNVGPDPAPSLPIDGSPCPGTGSTNQFCRSIDTTRIVNMLSISGFGSWWFRVVGQGGNGVVSPVFGKIDLRCTNTILGFTFTTFSLTATTFRPRIFTAFPATFPNFNITYTWKVTQ